MPRNNRRVPWTVLADDERGERQADEDQALEMVENPTYRANYRGNMAHYPNPERHPLHLPGSDHPGMQLVSTQLNSTNFHSWSRSIKIALGAKTKLGFINGKCLAPDIESEEYKLWKTVDCMVFVWLINSVSKELTKALIYAETAQELWDEICQRFGQSNGPMIYQLQRDICSYTQGTQTVLAYFNNLKGLWDELKCVMPIPVVTGDAGKKMIEYDEKVKLMQFLMGLSDVYESTRSQILIIEPLLSVNKAYAMKPDANVVKNFGYKPRMTKDEKLLLKCNYCEGTGHEESGCFKLHGFPDWYKKFKDQKKKNHANAVDILSATTQKEYIEGSAQDMGQLIKDEVARYFGGNVGNANCSYFGGYAGPEE